MSGVQPALDARPTSHLPQPRGGAGLCQADRDVSTPRGTLPYRVYVKELQNYNAEHYCSILGAITQQTRNVEPALASHMRQNQ